MSKKYKAYPVKVLRTDSFQRIPETRNPVVSQSVSRKGSWAALEGDNDLEAAAKLSSSGNRDKLDETDAQNVMTKSVSKPSVKQEQSGNSNHKLADGIAPEKEAQSVSNKNLAAYAKNAGATTYAPTPNGPKKLQPHALNTSPNSTGSNNALSSSFAITKEVTKSKGNLCAEIGAETSRQTRARGCAPVIYIYSQSVPVSNGNSEALQLANSSQANPINGAQKISPNGKLYRCDVRGWKPALVSLKIFSECCRHASLMELHFWNCSFDQPGLVALLQLIAGSGIKTIAFDSCLFETPHHLSLLLAERLHLESLAIRNCRMDDSLLAGVAAALKCNHKLRTLSLPLNRFSCVGVSELASALEYNQSLLHLDLSRNKLTDKAIQTLSRVLGKRQASPEEKLQFISWYQQTPNVATASGLSSTTQMALADIFRSANISATGTLCDGANDWSAKSKFGAGGSPIKIANGQTALSTLGGNAASKLGAKHVAKGNAGVAATATLPAIGANNAVQSGSNAMGVSYQGSIGPSNVTQNPGPRKGRANTRADERDSATEAQLSVVNDIRVELENLLALFFTEDGIDYRIGNRTLAMLNLEGCGLTEHTLEPLIQAVKQQMETKERTDLIFKSLSGCYGLFHVNLASNPLLHVNSAAALTATAARSAQSAVVATAAKLDSAVPPTAVNARQPKGKPVAPSASSTVSTVPASSVSPATTFTAMPAGGAAVSNLPKQISGIETQALSSDAKHQFNSQKLQGLLLMRNPFVKAVQGLVAASPDRAASAKSRN